MVKNRCRTLVRGTVAVFGEVKGQKQAEAAVCPGY